MIDRREALDRSIALFESDLTPGATPEQILTALKSTSVRIVSNAEVSATPAGQAAIASVLTCVARLGVQVEVSVPEGSPADATAPISDFSLLRPAASDLLDSLFGEGASRTPDLVISLCAPESSSTVCLGGADFELRLRIGESAGGWQGDLPFGAGLAGAAAAAEVTRVALAKLALLGLVTERYLSKLVARAFDTSLPEFAWPAEGVDAGSVDLVSAGAVTHAALFSILRLPGLSAALRVFDDDCGEVSNLNRYLLMRDRDIGKPKARAIERFSTENISIVGVEQRFNAASSEILAPQTLVGVDNVKGRHAVQRASTGWVGIAATSHLELVSSEHRADSPCAGCQHPTSEPLADRLPTISFVSMLAGTYLGYQFARHQVAPETPPEQLIVLDALNLAGESFHRELVAPTTACPLKCPASRELSQS